MDVYHRVPYQLRKKRDDGGSLGDGDMYPRHFVAGCTEGECHTDCGKFGISMSQLPVEDETTWDHALRAAHLKKAEITIPATVQEQVLAWKKEAAAAKTRVKTAARKLKDLQRKRDRATRTEEIEDLQTDLARLQEDEDSFKLNDAEMELLKQLTHSRFDNVKAALEEDETWEFLATRLNIKNPGRMCCVRASVPDGLDSLRDTHGLEQDLTLLPFHRLVAPSGEMARATVNEHALCRDPGWAMCNPLEGMADLMIAADENAGEADDESETVVGTALVDVLGVMLEAYKSDLEYATIEERVEILASGVEERVFHAAFFRDLARVAQWPHAPDYIHLPLPVAEVMREAFKRRLVYPAPYTYALLLNSTAHALRVDKRQFCPS